MRGSSAIDSHWLHQLKNHTQARIAFQVVLFFSTYLGNLNLLNTAETIFLWLSVARTRRPTWYTLAPWPSVQV